MSRLRIALLALLALGAAYGLGRFFAAELGAPAGAGGPSAVPLSAPPGFVVDEGGELTRSEAATRLAKALGPSGGQAHLALRFRVADSRVCWFVDTAEGGAAALVERLARSTGTRLETVYPGDPMERLRWAAVHGSLDAPGMPAGARHNLYH